MNLVKLQQYIKEGWVDATKHYTLPLTIYNYSRKTQFEAKWDEITLNCRGLILDNKNNIVAKAFPKFFNYEEIRYKNIIPINETPIIQNKEDGSLGIIFYYNEEWHVATRGSFHSEQAIKAKELLTKYNVNKFNKNYTYLVEIIYPENRIVLDYGNNEKLIFLSIIKDNELSVDECLKHWVYDCNIPKPHIINHGHKLINSNDKITLFSEELFKQLKENQIPNKEGYIIKFEPSGFRLKIKFEDYIALHKIITNITSYSIWEYLKDEKDINDLLYNVPDEFDKWVKSKIEEINKQYNYIHTVCYNHVEKLQGYSDINYWDRKQQALWIKNNVIPRYQGIVFSILDGKIDKKRNGLNYNEYIWKLCKPKYEKPFLQ